MKKIYLFAATQFEIIPTLDHLEKNFQKKSFFEYRNGDLSVFPIVTGVGSLMTSLGITRTPKIHEADLLINAGVAGSFFAELPIGSVVEVAQDRFADLGVEENDGSFTDVYELDLIPKDQFPFEDGWLRNKTSTHLRKAKSITVNKVHGTEQSINRIIEKYNPEIESMEGAGFFYALKIMDVEGIQLRSISNMVEPRNRDKWNLPLAIDALNKEIISIIDPGDL